MIGFARFDPADARLVDLIDQHAAHGDAHYPSESNHHMDGATLAREGVRLFVGTLDDTPVAMGGWKPFGDGAAELKSMHVLSVARGKGFASRIVTLILEDARREGRTEIFLEAGSLEASAAARALYEGAGFTYCPPFGDYAEDSNSVFMRRDL